MTFNPDDLTAIRAYLHSVTGLPLASLGISGDDAHAASGGYHIGNDGLSLAGRLNTDYSKRESSRDRPGTNAASALDIGQWRGAAGPSGISWLAFNRALAAACQRGDPRTSDVRELIYTPDGSTVRRFDRLGIRSTGDSSHLFHTHVSFFRDSEGRRDRDDNFLGLLRELIEGTGGDDDVSERLEWMADALEFGRATVGGGPVAGRQMWIVQAVQQLGGQVAELAARPSAAVTLTAEQARALAEQVVTAIGPQLEAIADRAAEAAIRRVLGGLDGASPPAGT